MRPRGSDDWDREYRQPDGIRANHDITQDDMEREAELDRWLGYALGTLAVLGVWKVLDLICAFFWFLVV